VTQIATYPLCGVVIETIAHAIRDCGSQGG